MLDLFTLKDMEYISRAELIIDFVPMHEISWLISYFSVGIYKFIKFSRLISAKLAEFIIKNGLFLRNFT